MNQRVDGAGGQNRTVGPHFDFQIEMAAWNHLCATGWALWLATLELWASPTKEETMSITKVQIEELQQAWQEGMAEVGWAFGSLQFGIAVHDITNEVALIMEEDDLEPIVRVLKHSMPLDVAALQAFLDAGGCNNNGSILITEADLKGRREISVSELLDIEHKSRHRN
jgi:hypothetical protein